MARNEPQVNVRIPAELKLRLEEAAAEKKRSVTAEIVARLEESFERMPSLTTEQLREQAEYLVGLLRTHGSNLPTGKKPP